jgi:hypothetical protein
VTLSHIPHSPRQWPADRYCDHLGVRPGPRTARRGRLCWAFGGRLVLRLGLPPFAAFSPRGGGVSCRLWASSRIIASKTALTAWLM